MPGTQARHSFVEGHPFAGLNGTDLVIGDPGQRDHRFVDEFLTALTDGAHRELGLERHAQLAHDDHVKGQTERHRHLVGHWHSPARNAEHRRFLTAQVIELQGQPTPCLDTISEEHHAAIIGPGRAVR